MQHLTHDTELGELRLALVHLGVVAGLIQSAYTEGIFDDVALDFVGQTRTGDVHDGMAHTVAVVQDVGQHTNLSSGLRGVMLLAAHDAPQAQSLGVQIGVAHQIGEGLRYEVRALSELIHVVVGVDQRSIEIIQRVDVAVVGAIPGQSVVLFLGQDLLEDLVIVGHDVAQGGGQFAVVVPQAQIVRLDSSVNAQHQLAVALNFNVLHILDEGGADGGTTVAQAGVGMSADNAPGLFHLRNVQGAVAADGAGGATGHLDGVLVSGSAMVLIGLLAAIANQSGLTRSGFTGIDGAAFSSTPHQAGMTGPTGGLVAVFRPGLHNGGNNVVVVGADQVLHDVVIQFHNLFGISNLHALRAVERDGLALLGAEDLTNASAAAVSDTGDDAGQVDQVFTSLTDGHNVNTGGGFLGDQSGGLAVALAPDMGSVANFRSVIGNVDVAGGFGSAFDDHSVEAAALHHHSSVAAHVSINDSVVLSEAGQSRDIGTTGAGSVGAGVGADSENDLVLNGNGIGAGGNFIIHDAVGHALTADILEILFTAFHSASLSGQVNAKQFTSPSVHNGTPPILMSSLQSSRDFFPSDHAQSAGGAASNAGAAADALGRLLGVNVDTRHMPGAGIGAQAAANALGFVDLADAGAFFNVDGLHGASVHAGGILALLAGFGSAAPGAEHAGAMMRIFRNAVHAGGSLAEVQVLTSMDAGHVRMAVAVVGQGAVDFAALAAGALGGVGNEHIVGGGDHIDQTSLGLSLGAAEQGQHAAGERDAGKALTGQLQELTTGILAAQQRLLVFRHNKTSLLNWVRGYKQTLPDHILLECGFRQASLQNGGRADCSSHRMVRQATGVKRTRSLACI